MILAQVLSILAASATIALGEVSTGPIPVHLMPYDVLVTETTKGIQELGSIQKDKIAGNDQAIKEASSKLQNSINDVLKIASSGFVNHHAVQNVLQPYIDVVAKVEKEVESAKTSGTSNDVSEVKDLAQQLYDMAAIYGIDTSSDGSALFRRGLEARDNQEHGEKAGQLLWGVQQATDTLMSNRGKTASGTIYGAINMLDSVVDGTAGFLGNILSIPTLGLSKALANFALGPLVQSINHGTFATISHLVGDPIDMVGKLIPHALSLSNNIAKISNQASHLNIDTTELEKANALLKAQIKHASEQAKAPHNKRWTNVKVAREIL